MGTQIHASVSKSRYSLDVYMDPPLLICIPNVVVSPVPKTFFDGMTERDVVSRNALIAGYTQNEDNEETLGLFCLLKRESVWPTPYTFGNLLNACANLADLNLGRQAHAHVLKHGFRFQSGSEPDIFVGNSLIDMCMK
ncbi:hypothetical protein U1Q18_014280 [Sarracenia purpurea var. burkii]